MPVSFRPVSIVQKNMKLKIDEQGKINLSLLDRLLFRLEFLFTRILWSFHRYKWRPYDPSWLVDLAQQQLPDDDCLHAALQKCTEASGTIPYIYFVHPRRANRPGSEWQFEDNIILEDPEKGELVLDVLKDGRVGGVEFLDVNLNRC